jgi:demethylmenaquinone methyltransferase/2-methoxy-6-polyprenyl-1,4-benzoquinol methylase
MSETKDSALSEQAAYYRARAPEYDEWWQRIGRYDRGPEATEQWNHEITQVEDALKKFNPRGDVLELASGTGWWTQRLAQTASTLTCVDASPEVIALNRARLTATGYPYIRYIEADLFTWQPEAKYDLVFFSFWLSHVPEDLFDSFWALVSQALRSNGRAFLIDSRAAESSQARDHTMFEVNGMQERRLNDGRSFRVFKRYWEAKELSRRLEQLSWTADLHDTPTYFVYGSACSIPQVER